MFGVFLPQLRMSFATIEAKARSAEELGYHSVWLMDHLAAPAAPEHDTLEGWTLAAALAARTSTVRLGHLVTANPFRHPALLAKMAATLDAVSHGRLILGYGAGWFAQEYEAYGYDFPPIGTRLRQLEEGLQILKRMWTEEQATFHGAHYHVENARCLPRPTRKPHPPILIGGAGEKVLLKLVARYADIWNNMGIFHREIGAKLEVLRRHCQRVGRSFDEIEISQQTVGAIGLSRDEARRRTEEVHREVGFLTGAPELCPTGTPDEIVSRLRESVQRGISSFVISFGRHAGAESLRLFAREVIPAFR